MSDVTEYAKIFGNVWANGLEFHVPRHLQSAVVNWVLHGRVDEDDVVHAIASNNLFETFRRGDATTLEELHGIVKFFWNYAPQPCFGSAHEAKRWRRAGGALGRAEG